MHYKLLYKAARWQLHGKVHVNLRENATKVSRSKTFEFIKAICTPNNVK